MLSGDWVIGTIVKIFVEKKLFTSTSCPLIMKGIGTMKRKRKAALTVHLKYRINFLLEVIESNSFHQIKDN
jgi:hypothetical protein